MIGITMSGLVGQMLSDSPGLATLPAGFLALSTIIATSPASSLMQRHGRRAGFLLGAVAGILGGALCVYAIFQRDFILFCMGNAILGFYQAIGNFYRLAAADYAPAETRGRAVSLVMAGGIVAALVSPTLSKWANGLFDPILFAGSFAAVVALSGLSIGLIGLLAAQEAPAAAKGTPSGGRPLRQLLRQPVLLVAIANAGAAHGIMILVMLSTPLAMVACGFAVGDATSVIQWHILGMFVPALFSGKLIDRFGAPQIAIVGALVLVVSAAVAMNGITFAHFTIALTLLGIGWNFMYVAGSTLIASAHRPEEKGRVQGVAEMMVAGMAAACSFASGGLLNSFGWFAVNLGAIALIGAAALATVFYISRTRLAPPAQA